MTFFHEKRKWRGYDTEVEHLHDSWFGSSDYGDGVISYCCQSHCEQFVNYLTFFTTLTGELLSSPPWQRSKVTNTPAHDGDIQHLCFVQGRIQSPSTSRINVRAVHKPGKRILWQLWSWRRFLHLCVFFEKNTYVAVLDDIGVFFPSFWRQNATTGACSHAGLPWSV